MFWALTCFKRRKIICGSCCLCFRKSTYYVYRFQNTYRCIIVMALVRGALAESNSTGSFAISRFCESLKCTYVCTWCSMWRADALKSVRKILQVHTYTCVIFTGTSNEKLFLLVWLFLLVRFQTKWESLPTSSVIPNSGCAPNFGSTIVELSIFFTAMCDEYFHCYVRRISSYNVSPITTMYLLSLQCISYHYN